ncbi:MAG: protein-disulfide reductase [Deltaproteobacteria bacterium]|nr:protein-disulfide reductase [Deltaproteobacteria bacterium]
MQRLTIIIATLVLVFGWALGLQAEVDLARPDEMPEVEIPVSLALEVFRMDPVPESGPPIVAVLWIDPDSGWHTYANDPGPGGFPTVVTARLEPDGLDIVPIYPSGQRKPEVYDSSILSNVFEGRTPVFLPIPVVPEDGIELRAQIRMLMCTSTTCLPVEEEVALNLGQPYFSLAVAQGQDWWPVWERSAPGVEKRPDGFSETDAPRETIDPTALNIEPRFFSPGLEVRSMGKAAVFAFLAGLILNFMPCVLPVITLKLRSFIPVVEGSQTRQMRSFREHNLFFALGMLIYFIILAVVIAMTGMAWGEIFQQPVAILVLAAVIFALGLSLFGVYNLPIIDLKAGASHHPRIESLFTGMLATILATPCSGPFLGGVLAWALIQPPTVIATVLFCIGLGMASPYMTMAVFPGMYRFLPRPGNWTVHLERILGFVLMATCVYLVGLLPSEDIVEVLILFLAIALGAWMWGNWTSLAQSAFKRWTIRGAALLMVVLTVFVLFRPEPMGQAWRPFTTQEFLDRLGRERIVLDFTADWCPNCKFLEKAVLTPGRRAEWERRYGAIFYQIDLTRENDAGSELLAMLGSRSIPVVALFSEDRPKSPLVLRDLFTTGQIEEALAAEFGPKAQSGRRE